MKKTLITLLVAGCMLPNMSASAKSAKVPAGGKAISDELIGIFFEDISYAADGGLYAELIQNGSFEFNPAERDGWGPGTAWKVIRPGHSLGKITALQQNPLNENNTNYMRLATERVGHYYDFDGWTGFGIESNGFNGIVVKAGAKYDFSVFMRNPDGVNKEIRVALVEPGHGFGPAATKDKVLAETTIKTNSKNWAKYTQTLTANADCSKAALRILSLTKGDVDVDDVSLMPQDTYKGHGMRKDLAEALAALNPKFMRFPGGCVVHGGGDGFWNTYLWKNTIGPKEARRSNKNTWGYHQSLGLGYYEYFQFCEDLNMQPLPILPCGVSCQGTNGGWSMKDQAQDVVPMEEIDKWAQDILDLIEWANGPVTSTWGKKRAEAGHPAPFNLKYVGIGNEERISPEFIERFKYIYNKVTKAHPEIVIVGTAGPGSHPGNRDYDTAWKLAEELDMPILDEHYYEPRSYYLDPAKRQYDNYPRDRKTKVYLGEYSCQERSHGNQLADALAEALYLIHVERNADVVCMTSYAPLFAYKENTNWNPDLIYFDNEKPFLTCSYYVQQMFGQSSGNYYYGNCVKIADKDDNQEQSVIYNSKTKEVFVKVCNVANESKKVTIDISRFGGLQSECKKTVLTGEPTAENNYEQHPVSPVVTTVKAQKKQTIEVAPNSLTMLSFKLK